MKLAVLSESPADEAAVRVLTDAILGRATEPVATTRLRTRGWPAVRDVLQAVVSHLHYRTDAEGLVVVVDSDDSPVHEPSHETAGAPMADCRLCELRTAIVAVRARLNPIPGRPTLKVAVGLAVPALEAWLLAGTDVHVTERVWSRSLTQPTRPYTRRELKRRCYGAEPVSLAVETQRMVEMATALAADLSPLKTRFPNGFGALFNVISGW